MSDNTNEEKEIEMWRNEHGEPDFAYLQSLVTTGTTESLEKLKSIAEDLDADVAPDASAEEIMDRIRMAVKLNDGGNSSETN